MSVATWSGAVMTHPNRANDQRWFGAWPRVVDDGRGLTRNFCATLEHAGADGAEWAVLAQDDVEPCVGLEGLLGGILVTVPREVDVAAFFSMGRVRDPRDCAAGVRWRARRRGELLWVMLLAVRQPLVAALVAGVAWQGRPADAAGGHHAHAGCDERLSLWMDAHGVRAATHIPNLVQHRGEASIIGHGWSIGGRPRMSPTYDSENAGRLYGGDR